jgi:hypothetical protein
MFVVNIWNKYIQPERLLLFLRKVGAEVQVTGGGWQSGGRHPRGKGRSLLAGRGEPEVTSEAKGDAPSRVSRHMNPPVSGAARLTAGRGRVALVLPDLSRCEGSRVPTPGECLACSSRLGQPTPCRGWPSQLCLTACYHLSIYLRLLYLHVSINKRVIPISL